MRVRGLGTERSRSIKSEKANRELSISRRHIIPFNLRIHNTDIIGRRCPSNATCQNYRLRNPPPPNHRHHLHRRYHAIQSCVRRYSLTLTHEASGTTIFLYISPQSYVRACIDLSSAVVRRSESLPLLLLE
jgi:hypothetical protein